MFSRDKIEKIESKQIIAFAFASCLLAVLCLLAYCSLRHSLISFPFLSNGREDDGVCCADKMTNDYRSQCNKLNGIEKSNDNNNSFFIARIRRRRQFREGEWTYWTSWTSCLEYPDLRGKRHTEYFCDFVTVATSRTVLNLLL